MAEKCFNKTKKSRLTWNEEEKNVFPIRNIAFELRIDDKKRKEKQINTCVSRDEKQACEEFYWAMRFSKPNTFVKCLRTLNARFLFHLFDI